MDEGLITDKVFIDLEKAFDTADHATLLRKLLNTTMAYKANL